MPSSACTHHRNRFPKTSVTFRPRVSSKEDWELITWLTYAGYLHMRLTRGWRGRRSAYFAIIGFAVVMFTFFGVTYLLPGLHSCAE
jgi:ABC-type transport system involved in cytochrome c biogenesis permease subunit